MTDTSLLTISAVLLLAFGLERLGSVLKVPSVILLIATGLVARPVADHLGLELKGIQHFVPFLGTLGLILIVLEGALDIRLHRKGIGATIIAALIALGGFLVCMVLYSMLGTTLLGLAPYQAALLAVPFAVISSAIAIPSSSFLPRAERDFVIYETSISDIIGVLVFFALLNSDGTLGGSLIGLIGGGMLSLVLATFCAVGLVLVLMRIHGHIRFIPLLAGLLFVYAMGKMLHLSPLIMVLLFGLVLNNPVMLTRFKLFNNWVDDSYEKTLNQFKMLIIELTFAVRGFFFILLGYWSDLADVASIESWLAALLILAIAYGSRFALLRIFRLPYRKVLIWLAPRGLITVLLYLQAREVLEMPSYLDGAVILVVLASSVLVIFSRIVAGRMPDMSASTRNDQEKA